MSFRYRWIDSVNVGFRAASSKIGQSPRRTQHMLENVLLPNMRLVWRCDFLTMESSLAVPHDI